MNKKKNEIPDAYEPYVPKRNPNVIRFPGAPYEIKLDHSEPVVPYSANQIDMRRQSAAVQNNAPARGKAAPTAAAPEYGYQNPAQNAAMTTLTTNRGLIKFWFLTLITLGIYSIWFWHKFAKDLNIACQYDGKHTAGIIWVYLLCIITLGIYPVVWMLKLVSRVDHGAQYYGERSRISVLSYVLWNTIGQIIFGAIISNVKLFRTMNSLCSAYNRTNFGQQ